MIPPDASPGSAPLVALPDINDRWLGVIIGALLPLLEPSAWQGAPAQQEQAAQRVNELIDMLIT